MSIMDYVYRNDIDIVRGYIQSGGAINNIQDEYGTTMLMIAAEYKYINMVQLLLQYGVYTDVQDIQGITPLIYAIDDIEVARLLLQYRANPSIQDIHGRTPLKIASRSRHIDTVQLLLLYGSR